MNVAPVVLVRQPGRTPLYVEVHGRLELGRDCDGLLLADGQVSRRHVELRDEAGRVILTDLGSTNGTTVAGERVGSSIELRVGVRALLGGTTVELVPRRAETFDERSTALGDVAANTARVDAEDRRRTSIDLVAGLAARDSWTPRRPSAGSTTTTIVFSDIESSTELATSLGDRAWFELLKEHNRRMRELLRRFDGSEVKSQGDGFMLTFPSARKGVLFAVAAQRAIDGRLMSPDDRSVRVRVGMHTGEAVADDTGDLFGRHVIVAARIANLASGGEVLVSHLVHEIASSTGDLVFGLARTVQLKGVPGDHLVYPVDWHVTEADS